MDGMARIENYSRTTTKPINNKLISAPQIPANSPACHEMSADIGTDRDPVLTCLSVGVRAQKQLFRIACLHRKLRSKYPWQFNISTSSLLKRAFRFAFKQIISKTSKAVDVSDNSIILCWTWAYRGRYDAHDECTCSVDTRLKVILQPLFSILWLFLISLDRDIPWI